MKITMTRNEKELTVALEGSLDTITSPELEEQLTPALEGVEMLIFELKELEYMSSAGLRVLLTAMQTMDEQGEMVVRNVCPTVMEVFEITGFAEALNIE